MNKEYNCLVCKHFDPDNIEIDHHNAMIRFCEHDGPSLKPCSKFELNEAKYNAKRFEPSTNAVSIYPSSSEMNKNEFKPCPFCGNKDITIEKVSHNAGMDGSYENWLIKCGVCFAEMNIPADNFYEREYYTEEEAIAMWNYRKEI